MATPVADNYSAASGFVMACGTTNSQAATALTVTDFLNNRVFQRITGGKSITISGTYTGNASVIEARIVDFTSGTAITAWKPVATFPTGGTYSGVINVPQGCWYRVQVRDGVNNAITAQGSNSFGVGIVIAMLGQSNMENRRATPGGYPLGDKRSIYFRDTLVWDRIGNINDSAALNTEQGGAGYGSPTLNGDSNGAGFVYTANLIAQHFNLPVCLVEFAASGASITVWMSGQTHWNNFVTRAGLAGGDFELALWHQGESDANTMSIATYKTNLTTLHTQLKTLTGRNNNTFKLGVIGLGIGSFSGSSEGEFGKIRQAHLEYARENAGAFYSTSAHDTYTTDGVHLGGDSFNKIARRDAKSIIAQMGYGVSAAGPRIGSATRSGSLITINIIHSGGSTLADGGGGTGSSLTGFEVFDNGVLMTILSTQITSNSTIELLLSAVPSGVVTLQYAMMNNPHGLNATTAPTLASIVYDNATYYNSTIGCPLQPLGAITVT